MRWPLSLSALPALAWGTAGLLWWNRRRRIPADGVPLTMATPALVRAVRLVEGVYGFWSLGRRSEKRSDDGRQ